MADSIKISELSELVSGSIQDGTIIPAVSASVTYHTKMSSIKAYLADSLATDNELVGAVFAINSFTASITQSVDEIIDDLTFNEYSINQLSVVSQSYKDTSGSLSQRVSGIESDIATIGSDYAKKSTSNTFTGINSFQNVVEFTSPIIAEYIYPVGTGFGYPRIVLDEDNGIFIETPNAIQLRSFSPSVGSGSITVTNSGSISIYSTDKVSFTGSVLFGDKGAGFNSKSIIESAQFTDSETGSLAPLYGSIMWNSTRLKLQVYTDLGWTDLH